MVPGPALVPGSSIYRQAPQGDLLTSNGSSASDARSFRSVDVFEYAPDGSTVRVYV